MAIEIGDRIPQATFKVFTADGMQDVSSGELFDGKRVVLFAVPGAFTPTCNDTHLPGFLVRSDEIKDKGVNTIACVAVNDAFVVSAWGKATGASDHIRMLSDGNGDFARAMGLELDATGFAMGKRSQRYAAIVDDGVVRYLGVETGPGVGVSSAEAVLAELAQG
ncbi:MAG: peroxiredoxin [bacterium]|nr:peroxiredoxin [bacterium]